MQRSPHRIPEGLEDLTTHLLVQAEQIEGFLSPREMKFLCLLGAVRTSTGEILEIGSFKGRSTMILARASVLAGDVSISAVDPMSAPSETDPDLQGEESSYEDFRRNLAAHEVEDRVHLHRMFSFELAKSWKTPLRLLWIDGDHTYAGTRADFEGFAPHLSDGAIVAIHDVLHEFEGGIRVFIENVLLSPDFAACGFCGSIAWAQYVEDKSVAADWRDRKLALYRRLAPLVRFLALGKQLSGFEKKIYKLYRSRIPRSEIEPEKWIKTIY